MTYTLPTKWGYYNKLQFSPIGEILDSITVEEDTVVLIFSTTKVVLGCEGDYCAHAYFSDLEIQSNLPAGIVQWDDSKCTTTEASDNFTDTQFIKIKTDSGYIDLSLHTEHNGYYGGSYFVQSVEEIT